MHSWNEIRGVMKDKYRLADKFGIVAMQLSAIDADKDVIAFREAKKVRDELFHGSNIDENTLPVASVRSLLVKYLQLHLGEHPRPTTVKSVRRIAGRYDPSRHK